MTAPIPSRAPITHSTNRLRYLPPRPSQRYVIPKRRTPASLHP
jgi:hypothetical protein